MIHSTGIGRSARPIIRNVQKGPTIAIAPTLCAALALFSPWANYMQIAPFITPVTLIVALMTVYMVVRLLRSPVLSIARRDMYLLLYVILVTLSFFWALSTENWGNNIFWWYICVATYFAARSAPRSAAHFRLLSYAFFIGMLITFLNLQLTFDEWGSSSGRYNVFDHNSNFTAYVLSGGLFLFLATWSYLGPTRAMVLLMPIWIGMTVYCQILLGTRGALLSSGLTVCLFLFRRVIPNAGLKAIIITFSIIAFSVAVGLNNYLLLFFDSFGLGRGTGDLSNRGFIWVEAYSYILSNPVLGIGPGVFSEISELRAGAHNLFLTISLETGLVGMFLFGGYLFLYFLGILRESRSNREGLLLLAMFSCFWFPIVSSGHWELAPFSWLLLGFFQRLTSIERDGASVRIRVFADA